MARLHGLIFVGALVGACGSSTGSSGGECYPNATCNDGLVCVEGTCRPSITVPDGGGGGPELDGGGGDGGGADAPVDCTSSCGSSAGECDGTSCGSGAYCVSGGCVTTGACKTAPNNTCSNDTYSLRLNDPECADTSTGVNDYNHQPCPNENFGDDSNEHDWGLDWFLNGANIPAPRLLIVYPLSDWWVGVQIGYPCSFACLSSYVAEGPGRPVVISLPPYEVSPSWEVIVEGVDTHGGGTQEGRYVISFEDAPSMRDASTTMTRVGEIDVADIQPLRQAPAER